MSQLPLLQVKGLCVDFSTRKGNVQVLDHLALHLAPGETLGIVGESGCGKSMTALSIMQLIPVPPGNISGGQILLNDTDLLQLSESRMKDIRGNDISMIFQEPMTSLNPVFTIGTQVSENIRRHQSATSLEARDKTIQILEAVGIPASEVWIKQYPHELSGGMRQRIMIAMAISCQPKVLIADEPTTALDVTIQLQYLRLLKEIQAETGLSIIFITHDFGVVARMCDRVAVMYAGRIIESGAVRDIFDAPSHPYTKALIASVPKMEEKVDRLPSIEGHPPLLSDLPVGCRFEPRCPVAKDKCRQEYPVEFSIKDGHTADCWELEN